MTLIVVGSLFAGVAMLACWMPVRRAAEVAGRRCGDDAGQDDAGQTKQPRGQDDAGQTKQPGIRFIG